MNIPTMVELRDTYKGNDQVLLALEVARHHGISGVIEALKEVMRDSGRMDVSALEVEVVREISTQLIEREMVSCYG